MPTERPAFERDPRRPRVPQRRIAESIADELRDLILAQDEDESFRLPTQDQLVREFGVSYPSMREAIRILETEGLVSVRRGKVGGIEIHRPSQASAAYHLGLTLQAAKVPLADLAAGLQMFEPMCAAECARRKDRAKAVVPVLEASIEGSAELVGDGIAFTEAAREFHSLVVQLTPNATVRHVVSTLVELWSGQERAWAEQRSRRGSYPSEVDAQEVVRTHRRILKEIAAGNAAEAERIARVHLAATQEIVVDGAAGRVVNARSTKERFGDSLCLPRI